jgi:outer membrane protein OmpA-like peptidoglycan-associated protein
MKIIRSNDATPRNVIGDIIDSGNFVGRNKPNGKVTVVPYWNLRKTDDEIDGVVDGHRGPYRYWMDETGDLASIEVVVPNIQSIEISRSIDQPISTCSIRMYNQSHNLNTESPELITQLGKPGYYWFERGKTSDPDSLQVSRWNQSVATGGILRDGTEALDDGDPFSWQNVIIPNAMLKTYQGYGGHSLSIDDALLAGNITQTGVWIIDHVSAGTDGMLTIECRDVGKLLEEQRIFPPVVPPDLYPVEYSPPGDSAYASPWDQPPLDQLADGNPTQAYGFIPMRVRASSIALRASEAETVDVAVDGHNVSDCLDDDPDTYSLSQAADTPISHVDWWEFEPKNNYEKPCTQITIKTYGGGYTMYVSVWDGVGWIPNEESLTVPNGRNIDLSANGDSAIVGEGIPYVAKYPIPSADPAREKAFTFDLPYNSLTSEPFHFGRVRLSFTHHSMSIDSYRCGIREVDFISVTDIENQLNYMAKADTDLAVSIAAHPVKGYWVLTRDGEVLNNGGANYYGRSTPELSTWSEGGSAAVDAVPATPGTPGTPATPGHSQEIELDAAVLFNLDSYVVKTTALGTLLNAAAVIRDLPPGSVVFITGHASTDGAAAHNMTLSKNRAQAVYTALTSIAIESPYHISSGPTWIVTGQGENSPKYSPGTSPKNRRVDILVVAPAIPGTPGTPGTPGSPAIPAVPATTGTMLVHGGCTSITAHPSGNGYWILQADGTVEAFGTDASGAPLVVYGQSVDATYADTETDTVHVTHRGIKAMGIASNFDGSGYWVVWGDATIRGFGGDIDGDVWYLPVTSETLQMEDQSERYSWPVPYRNLRGTAICSHPTALGFWAVDGCGGVYANGAAQLPGTQEASQFNNRTFHKGLADEWTLGYQGEYIDSIECTLSGKGYWLTGLSGRIAQFGDAVGKGVTDVYAGHRNDEIPVNPYSESDPNVLARRTDRVQDLCRMPDDNGFYALLGSSDVLVLTDWWWGNPAYWGYHSDHYQAGLYDDYTEIVKEVIAWAGFALNPVGESLTGRLAVNAFLENTGINAESKITIDQIDKKSILDVISMIKEVVAYLLWVDDNGAVHFESPNFWKAGNYITSENVDDGRIWTSEIPVIDERINMMAYSAMSDAESIVSQIIIGSNEPSFYDVANTVFTKYTPPIDTVPLKSGGDATISRGIVRTAMWVNEVFTNPVEQKLMAELIALQAFFSQRIGNVTTIANPALQINDQVRLIERNTSESYIHYIRSINSSMDLDSGVYVMSMQTNWLGTADDNWVITRDNITDVLTRIEISELVDAWQIAAGKGLETGQIGTGVNGLILWTENFPPEVAVGDPWTWTGNVHITAGVPCRLSVERFGVNVLGNATLTLDGEEYDISALGQSIDIGTLAAGEYETVLSGTAVAAGSGAMTLRLSGTGIGSALFSGNLRVTGAPVSGRPSPPTIAFVSLDEGDALFSVSQPSTSLSVTYTYSVNGGSYTSIDVTDGVALISGSSVGDEVYFKATTALGTSASSNLAIVSGIPPAPVVVSADTAGSGFVDIAFTQSGNGGSPILGYKFVTTAESYSPNIVDTLPDDGIALAEAGIGLVPGSLVKLDVLNATDLSNITGPPDGSGWMPTDYGTANMGIVVLTFPTMKPVILGNWKLTLTLLSTGGTGNTDKAIVFSMFHPTSFTALAVFQLTNVPTDGGTFELSNIFSDGSLLNTFLAANPDVEPSVALIVLGPGSYKPNFDGVVLTQIPEYVPTAGTTSPLRIPGLVDGQEVKLKAFNSAGDSVASNAVTIGTSDPTVPNAPKITFTGLYSGNARIRFVKGDVNDGGSPITNYKYLINGTASVGDDPLITKEDLIALTTKLNEHVGYPQRMPYSNPTYGNGAGPMWSDNPDNPNVAYGAPTGISEGYWLRSGDGIAGMHSWFELTTEEGSDRGGNSFVEIRKMGLAVHRPSTNDWYVVSDSDEAILSGPLATMWGGQHGRYPANLSGDGHVRAGLGSAATDAGVIFAQDYPEPDGWIPTSGETPLTIPNVGRMRAHSASENGFQRGRDYFNPGEDNGSINDDITNDVDGVVAWMQARVIPATSGPTGKYRMLPGFDTMPRGTDVPGPTEGQWPGHWGPTYQLTEDWRTLIVSTLSTSQINSWDDPPLPGYLVEGGSTGTYVDVDPADTTSPIDVPASLTDTIVMKATNAIGDSPASNKVTVTSAFTAIEPDPPTIAFDSYDIGAGTADILITAPADNGGASITKYQWDNGDDVWTDMAGTSSPQTITVGRGAVVRVRAVNSAGASYASNFVQVQTVPDAPTSLTVVSYAGGVATINASAGNTGGSSVFAVQARINSGSWDYVPYALPILVTCSLGDVVEFRLVNGVGPGVASAPVTVETLPAAPTSLTVDDWYGGSAIISFTDPANDGGHTITDYEFKVNSGSWASYGSTTSPFTIAAALGATVYLRAVTTFGSGPSGSVIVASPTSMVPAGEKVMIRFIPTSSPSDYITYTFEGSGNFSGIFKINNWDHDGSEYVGKFASNDVVGDMEAFNAALDGVNSGGLITGSPVKVLLILDNRARDVYLPKIDSMSLVYSDGSIFSGLAHHTKAVTATDSGDIAALETELGVTAGQMGDIVVLNPTGKDNILGDLGLVIDNDLTIGQITGTDGNGWQIYTLGDHHIGVATLSIGPMYPIDAFNPHEFMAQLICLPTGI